MTDPVRATEAVVDFIVRASRPEFPAEAIALAERASADSTGGLSLMRLWFLYYLLIFYVAMAVAVPIVRRLPKELSAAI